MFEKLRLRLTLANLSVVLLVFVIVFTGVYITMYNSITNQSQQLMNLLTYSAVSGGEPQNAKMLGLLGNQSFIVAEISSSGAVTSYRIAPSLPGLEKENIVGLVNSALSQNILTRKQFYSYSSINPLVGKSMVIIMDAKPVQSDSGINYRTRLIRTSEAHLTIIFVNIDYEKSLLNSLRLNLIVIALAGLGLVFGASLFMAGKAVKPIKAAWEKQKNFVADASHELRTPLSVMQTNLELVMENSEETVQSQEKWLDNIYAENRHMTKLVNDLLLLARIDSDQKLLELKGFSMSDAVEEAVMPFVPVAGEKGIELSCQIKPDITFMGDESRIRQLVVILTDNAVKYTPSGGSISISLSIIKDSIEMAVADTGMGIAHENLSRIFERFYRIDESRSGENAGIGLGLSIAGWIVKEHHGIIRVESELGKGTIFKVIFSKNPRYKTGCLGQ